MAEFRMPSLGADMESGTLVEWLVEAGAEVAKGDIIAVVETQKGAIEIETFEAGVVLELKVPEGDKVPVGAVLALIGEASEAGVEVSEPTPKAQPKPPPSPPPRPITRPSQPAATRWVRSSPSARRRAFELDVDLAQCHGTGPHGAVTRKDVEAQAGLGVPKPPSTPSPAPSPVKPSTSKPVSSGQEAMRRAIAAAMSRSNREIPHYFLAQEIDLSRALAHLEQLNRERSVQERILPAVLLIKAVGLALKKHPQLNGSWITSEQDPVGAFHPAEGIHVGIAISLRGGGLVIPALTDVDQKSLPTLMEELGQLVERARAGRLRAGDLSRSTITLTNLGDQGVDQVQGVIYPPQVALVGFGRVAERPVAVDGMLGVRPTVVATLAADHRASDGHTGARFLSRVQRLLTKPEKL